MKKIKKLTLNKETIAQLTSDDQREIRGGGWTAGCTDGCGSLATWLNCSNADCTNDCDACVTSAYDLEDCPL